MRKDKCGALSQPQSLFWWVGGASIRQHTYCRCHFLDRREPFVSGTVFALGKAIIYIDVRIDQSEENSITDPTMTRKHVPWILWVASKVFFEQLNCMALAAMLVVGRSSRTRSSAALQLRSFFAVWKKISREIFIGTIGSSFSEVESFAVLVSALVKLLGYSPKFNVAQVGNKTVPRHQITDSSPASEIPTQIWSSDFWYCTVEVLPLDLWHIGILNFCIMIYGADRNKLNKLLKLLSKRFGGNSK